jgi:hypothetical protein
MSGYDEEFKSVQKKVSLDPWILQFSKQRSIDFLNPSILKTKVNRFLESFHFAHKQTKQTSALWGYGFLESFCFVLKQTEETSAMWTHDS